MDNNTIKEISDVISDNLMNQIRHNLSEIKPELINEITETVRKSISTQLDDLEARISKLESNTTEEIKTVNFNKPKTNLNNSDTILYSPQWGSSPLSDEQIAKIINKCVEVNKRKPSAVDNKKILTPSKMDEILKNPKNFVIGNGWIYYIVHYSYSASLYKVKLNGTENQWIPDIKLTCHPEYFDEFYLEGNDLHYTTNDGLPRVIDVGIKTNETVSNDSKKRLNIFKRLKMEK